MYQALFAATLACLGLSSISASATLLSTKYTFDPSLGEVPESITTDRAGNLFFSMGQTIQRLSVSGERSTWATLPISAFALGVKVGPDGCVYAASTSLSSSPGAYVWRSCRKGQIQAFAELDQSGGPNDLAFDEHGNLFVTDPFLGQVYRITPKGVVSTWLSDPLLEGNPSDPILDFHACGVDGIAFDRHHRNLYLGNLDFGLVLRVKVRRDGSAGPVEVVSSDANLVGIDGIAFDDRGSLYATINSQNAIAVVDKKGHSRWLLQGEPLDSPSSIVFSSTPFNRHRAFLLSSSFSRAFGFVEGTPEPALHELKVAVPGLRLP